MCCQLFLNFTKCSLFKVKQEAGSLWSNHPGDTSDTISDPSTQGSEFFPSTLSDLSTLCLKICSFSIAAKSRAAIFTDRLQQAVFLMSALQCEGVQVFRPGDHLTRSQSSSLTPRPRGCFQRAPAFRSILRSHTSTWGWCLFEFSSLETFWRKFSLLTLNKRGLLFQIGAFWSPFVKNWVERNDADYQSEYVNVFIWAWTV